MDDAFKYDDVSYGRVCCAEYFPSVRKPNNANEAEITTVWHRMLPHVRPNLSNYPRWRCLLFREFVCAL